MKLKFTRKTWYFFLLAAAAMSMLGGFAVLGRHGFFGAGTDRVLHHRHCSAVFGRTEGCSRQG